MPASSQSYLYRQDKYTSVSRKSQAKWGFLKAPAHLIKILKLGYRGNGKAKENEVKTWGCPGRGRVP